MSSFLGRLQTATIVAAAAAAAATGDTIASTTAVVPVPDLGASTVVEAVTLTSTLAAVPATDPGPSTVTEGQVVSSTLAAVAATDPGPSTVGEGVGLTSTTAVVPATDPGPSSVSEGDEVVSTTATVTVTDPGPSSVIEGQAGETVVSTTAVVPVTDPGPSAVTEGATLASTTAAVAATDPGPSSVVEGGVLASATAVVPVTDPGASIAVAGVVPRSGSGLDGARALIEQPLRDSVAVPVQFPGVAMEPPDGAWVRLTILWGDAFGRTMGADAGTMVVGLIALDVFDRPGTGAGRVTQIADQVRALYNGVDLGPVRCRAAGGPTPADEKGGWLQVRVRVPFEVIETVEPAVAVDAPADGLDGARALIEQPLREGFAGTPVQFPGVAMEPPDDGPWMRLSIEWGAGTEFGMDDGTGPSHQVSGVIAVDVFGAPGIGVLTLSQLADQVRDLYHHRDLGPVRCQPAGGPSPGNDKPGWQQVTVRIPFELVERIAA